MFRNTFIIILFVLLVSPSFGLILPSDYTTDTLSLNFQNGLNQNFIFYDNLNSSILPQDSNILSATNNYFNSYQYLNTGFINNNWLSKTKCFLSKSNQNNISANFDFGALNDPKSLVYKHLTNNAGLNYDPILFPQILRNNLYMHSNLTYYLYNQTNHLVDSYSVTVLVDPNGYSIPLSIYSNAKIENNFASTFGYGNYFVNYTITPTEVKCDFNGNSLIDFSETSLVFNSSFQSFTIIQPITDLDNDNYDDGVCKLAYPNCSNLTQVNTTFRDYVNPSKIDSCPNISGVGLNNGCFENYTSLSCNGMANFTNGVLCQTMRII